MSTFETLDFIDALRLGGPDRQKRRFHDYVIGGHPLSAMITVGDNIAPFGWLPTDLEARFARWLLLREPSELPSGRVPLYICPECGDLGCQSMSARVIEEHDRYIWTELAYEASYDVGPATPVLAIRPFHFEKSAYEAALRRAVGGR